MARKKAAKPSARKPVSSAGSTRSTAKKPARKSTAAKPAQAAAKRKAEAPKVSRAATPRRSAALRTAKVRREQIPHPMPLRHVAAPPPVTFTPARSMPQFRDERPVETVLDVPLPDGPLDFTDAGVLLGITYSIREGRRDEFFNLMRELKPLLVGIGGHDCVVYEDRSRSNYFMEVFRFKDEAEFTAFDDKFHKDRKIAAIYSLLDDIVEAEKSDFKIFERRL
jgi:hypothetical protein